MNAQAASRPAAAPRDRPPLYRDWTISLTRSVDPSKPLGPCRTKRDKTSACALNLVDELHGTGWLNNGSYEFQLRQCTAS
jgi:hypothetical protein